MKFDEKPVGTHRTGSRMFELIELQKQEESKSDAKERSKALAEFEATHDPTESAEDVSDVYELNI